ncbi:MAG: hypothetical protein ACLPVY_00605 [Acidimicrobiia bacterium]
MRNKPFSALVTMATIVVSVTLVGVSPAGAAVNAHGTVTCRVLPGGSGSVNPALTPAGSPGTVKINFAAQLVPPVGTKFCGGTVTSPAGVKVLAGHLSGGGFYNNVPGFPNGSACANFTHHDNVGSITVTIGWTVSGPPIAGTTVTYTGNPGTVTNTGGVDTITLHAPLGTAHKAGSFAFPPAGLPNTVKIKTTLPASPPPCGPGPFKNFNITGGSVSM